MAEEIQSNGSLQLKLSENRFLGISGRDAVLLAFILLIGIIGYLRTNVLDRGLAELKLGQTNLAVAVQDQTEDLRREIATMKQMLLRHDFNMNHELDARLPLDILLPEEKK